MSLVTLLYCALYKVASIPDFRFLCVSLLSLSFCGDIGVISLIEFLLTLSQLFGTDQKKDMVVMCKQPELHFLPIFKNQ